MTDPLQLEDADKDPMLQFCSKQSSSTGVAETSTVFAGTRKHYPAIAVSSKR